MILFFQNGELGNQIFQYCGLKKYFPNHKLIFFGCEKLKNTFDNLEVSFISKEKYFSNFRFLILKNILFFLVKLYIIGRIAPSKSFHFNFEMRRGILFNVFILDSIFFQHRDFIKDLKTQIVIKKNILQSARKWLKKKKIPFTQNRLVFVHIRRDDYIHGPFKKFPSVLDLSWYRKAMMHINKKISRPIFILMGNDKFYMKDIFKETDSLFISNNVEKVDLAIMTMCTHGILSASSFAWWGAFFSRTKTLTKIHSYFVAPKFWMGHRLKKWYPSNFFSEWIVYLK
jgi:hypothetical protein